MVTYSLALRNRAAAKMKLLAVRGGYRKLQVRSILRAVF